MGRIVWRGMFPLCVQEPCGSSRIWWSRICLEVCRSMSFCRSCSGCQSCCCRSCCLVVVARVVAVVVVARVVAVVVAIAVVWIATTSTIMRFSAAIAKISLLVAGICVGSLNTGFNRVGI